MIIGLLVFLGILLGVAGSEIVRRAGAPAGNPMLEDLRARLEDMERDYRLRVATEELSWPTDPHLGPPRG